MIVAIPTETFPDERRVAVAPVSVGPLTKAGAEVRLQADAGFRAGFTDADYTEKGATIVADRAELLRDADVVCQVRAWGANAEHGGGDLDLFKPGAIVIGHAEPLTAHDQTKAFADKGLTLAAMEMIPRISRAQSMDALSSQANLAGYKAVLIAADTLGQVFPMMMTAAGTLKPAKVFIVGVGVAGLQAIATAKRLGALVSATDVRPDTKEQVESLGGKFVMVEEAMAEGEGGYARELTPQQQEKQRQLVSDAVAESDVVITTAAIPGRKAPVIVTDAMVQRMRPGSVIVDLAAERGGNVEGTESGRTLQRHNVTIVGTNNLPSLLATDASNMYSGNITKLLQHLAKDGRIELDFEDEITAGVVATHDGQVVNRRIREAMGMEPIARPQAAEEANAEEDA